MKNAIDWIKSNLIVTGCAVVSLLGVVVIAYFYTVSAPAFSEAKSKELKEQQQRQRSLQNISVPLPNSDPNAPPDDHRVVVNPIVITEVGRIYTQMQTQYESILGNAKAKNSQNHIQFVLGGGNIWPDASPTQFFDLYVRAASDYKDHFTALFDTRNTNKWNIPRMVASSPPTAAELQLLLSQSAFDFISSVGAQAPADLSENQAKQLYAEQRMKLMDVLNRRARSIHLYAQLPPEQDPFASKEVQAPSQSTPPTPGFGFGEAAGAAADKDSVAGYPFLIADWADSDQPPTPDQLWEGQVQLWIMRDIMSTIYRVNNINGTVKSMGPDGIVRDEPASVVNSPIKRLLKLQTLDGYVGLHNTGAALGEGMTDLATGRMASSSPITASSSLGMPGQPAVSTPSIYPTPPIELAPQEATDRAVEHFGITPTGRVSNSTFDVRHSQLTIDIEAGKLPGFIDSLNQTNFMTVIKAEITDLDEYELLRDGYIYGSADVVRADLIVESLWFRSWTEALMPKIVKEKLLIIKPEVEPEFDQFEPF